MLGRLILVNLKMIYRDRQALFWALAFPLIFVTVFGLFNLDDPPEVTLAVVDNAQDELSTRLIENLGNVDTFNIVERQDEAAARQEMRDGDQSYLLIIPADISAAVTQDPPAAVTLVYDESSATSAIVIGVVERFVGEVNQGMTGEPTLLELASEGIASRQLGYYDFLLPGFVAMGVMTYAIIGLASVISVYREQKILKRIMATPLRVRTFFTAQIVAYLILSVGQAAIILAAGIFLFGANVYGSYLYLGLLVIAGNIVFLNLGFIVGAFSNTVSAASGLGNAVAMPMMFLSGTFFPTDNMPSIVASVVRFLPLTPMLEAMRGVALDARPIWDFPQELAILGAWIVISAVVATRVFRFG